MTETFIKSRKHNLTGKVEPVGIDDASLFLARFRNGSLATFEATRYARGHKALYTFEINGEHASISGTCTICTGCSISTIATKGIVRGWQSLHITDREHPYMGNWWVPGLQIGYEHSFVHQAADFLTAAAGGKSRGADVPRRAGDGLRHGRGSGIRGEAQLGESRAPGRGALKEKVDDAESTRIRWFAAAACFACAGAAGGRTAAGRAGDRLPRARRAGAADAAAAGSAADRAGGGVRLQARSSTARASKGWDCDPDFWRVEGGVMVGETKADHQPPQNIFCIWRGGKPADFELKLQYKMYGRGHRQQRHSISQHGTAGCRASGC